MSRVRAHPVATLMAGVSAILIVFGRAERDVWWGNWLLAGGFAVLVAAGVFTLRPRR